MPPGANQTAANLRVYVPHLLGLMHFLQPDRVVVDYTEYTQEDLGLLTPADIYGFMAMKAYGKVDPTGDDHPTFCRSSTLEFVKKAISSFMPNRLPTWNVLTMMGNPTKSTEVNNLIKDVKKHKVRKQGVASCAVRPFEPEEFEQLISTVMLLNDRYVFLVITIVSRSTLCTPHYFVDCSPLRYALVAFYQFQFNMISRVDDAAQLTMDCLKPNPTFPYTLLCTVNWSKNVLEERAASDQILFGSINPRYCVLLGLGIHLEFYLADGIGAISDRVFTLANSVTGSKARAAHEFKKIVDSPAFVKAGLGPLGTHSLRKFPATFARRNGCSRDDVDHRGRWKSDKRIVDRYIHCDLPYPDAKVASALCIGGTCKYEYRDGSGLTDGWLLSHVVPQVNARFGERMALVLGKALMWGLMESEEADSDLYAYVPQQLKTSVKENYQRVEKTMLDGLNPIIKIRLNVSGYEGTVHVNEVGEQTIRAATADGGAPNERQELIGLYSIIENMQRYILEVKTEVEQHRHHNDRCFEMLGKQVRRIALQPVARVARQQQQDVAIYIQPTLLGDGREVAAAPIPAQLSKLPRTLDELWIEYDFGLGGRKAARLFTREERGGKNKHNYYRRNVLWKQVSDMVRAGESAQVAVDRVRAAYGENLSVTATLTKMLADKRRGGHPQLRV
jgi:hypothetical protein